MPEKRFRDFGIRLRVLNDDGSPGDLRPEVLGGRWDTWTSSWVTPTPDDLDCVEWTIQRQQIPVILECPREVQLVALFAGRQAGKSRIALTQAALDGARYPGRDTFVISLDFKASREPEETFLSILPPQWGVKWSKSERIATWPHGHRTLFRSAENIDSCRGPSTKTIILDEASRMSHDVFVAAVGCGAASKDFRLYLPTTPKRETRWLRAVNDNWGKDRISKIYRLRTEDNPRRNRPLLEKIAEDLPADLVAQEFGGEIVAPEHAVYYLFSRELHLRMLGDLPEYLRPPEDIGPEGRTWQKPIDWTVEFCRHRFGVPGKYILGWDFGKEATVWGKVFRERRLARTPEGRMAWKDVLRLWIVGEAVNHRTTTEHHAQDVLEELDTDQVVVITDAMGAKEKSEGRGASGAAIRLLREAGFLKVVPVAAANPDVENSIRAVLRLFKSAKGKDTRLFIAKDERGRMSCPRLVEALESQHRDELGNIVMDGNEHVIDALRYLVWRTFPVRAPGQDRHAQTGAGA